MAEFSRRGKRAFKITCTRELGVDSDATEEDLLSNKNIQQEEDVSIKKKRTNKYVLACAIFASFNSVLLGCDVGAMSGALSFTQEDLMISDVQEEVLVGILSIISLLGILAGGKTSDAIGRKLLAGVGIGFGIMIVPVYIAEISPSAIIGSLPLSWGFHQSRNTYRIHFKLCTFSVLTIEWKKQELCCQRQMTMKEVEERLDEIQQAAGIADSEKYEPKAVWLISALSVAFVHVSVPEAKGKSMEQIEMLFQKREREICEVELGDVERLVQKEWARLMLTKECANVRALQLGSPAVPDLFRPMGGTPLKLRGAA
ncbi:unnamed protein product [Dovyalis caffra]|uniref:Major facilitator superfamily (MFS) profile domain-containing protein n=1 Tax=Dovyalis caffra TaxID=77055 RepID=A0AAV1SJQ2_9ROSI|nr:unnamed protein product [Dovyalis caffra]